MPSKENQLQVGFLTELGGIWDVGLSTSGALPLAIEAVNKDLREALHGYQLDFLWRDSGCHPGKALAAMSELLELGVDVFIGPSCSWSSEPTRLLSSNRGVPQVPCGVHLTPVCHQLPLAIQRLLNSTFVEPNVC